MVHFFHGIVETLWKVVLDLEIRQVTSLDSLAQGLRDHNAFGRKARQEASLRLRPVTD